MESVEIIGKGSLVGKRLDLAMVDGRKGLSRRKAKTLIDSGSVFVNGNRVRIASRKIEFDDRITFQYSPEAKRKAQRIVINKEDILFHKDGVIAINKPAGLASQPTRAGDKSHAVRRLQEFFESQDQNYPNLSLVHRLDKETTGVLLLAETQELAQEMMKQFREKTVKKVYHAVCYGKPQGSFQVNCKLSSINPKNGVVKVSRKSGKDSFTEFERLEFSPSVGLSLVKCEPLTGRSHQIRVHLDHAGYPILGDKVYGRSQGKLAEEIVEMASKHHFLHARSISFHLPGNSGKVYQVKAPYSETWKEALGFLRA